MRHDPGASVGVIVIVMAVLTATTIFASGPSIVGLDVEFGEPFLISQLGGEQESVPDIAVNSQTREALVVYGTHTRESLGGAGWQLYPAAETAVLSPQGEVIQRIALGNAADHPVVAYSPTLSGYAVVFGEDNLVKLQRFDQDGSLQREQTLGEGLYPAIARVSNNGVFTTWQSSGKILGVWLTDSGLGQRLALSPGRSEQHAEVSGGVNEAVVLYQGPHPDIRGQIELFAQWIGYPEQVGEPWIIDQGPFRFNTPSKDAAFDLDGSGVVVWAGEGGVFASQINASKELGAPRVLVEQEGAYFSGVKVVSLVGRGQFFLIYTVYEFGRATLPGEHTPLGQVVARIIRSRSSSDILQVSDPILVAGGKEGSSFAPAVASLGYHVWVVWTERTRQTAFTPAVQEIYGRIGVLRPVSTSAISPPPIIPPIETAVSNNE